MSAAKKNRTAFNDTPPQRNGGGRKDSDQKRQMQDFLRAYRLQECLWNNNIKEYSKQSARQDAVQELADRFEMNAEQVKRKIHAIRSTYNQMRIKVLDAEANGRVYTPILSWYKEASFLDSVITLRKNRESLPAGPALRFVESVHHTKGDDEDTELEVHMKAEEALQSHETRRRKNARASTTSFCLMVAPETGELTVEADESGQFNHDEVTEHTIVEMEDYNAPTTVTPRSVGTVSKSELVTPAAKDEFALFSDFMVSQLRAISAPTAIQLMCNIQGMVSQARLEELSKK